MNIHTSAFRDRFTRDGMSDDQLKIEHKVQTRLFKAIQEMKAAIADVNAGSSVVQIGADSFADWVDDEVIDAETWQSRIEEARS